MTHTDYEEAICDNPGTLYFPQADSDCGCISPIHLLDCLFALRAAHAPATGQFPPGNILHTSILFPWDAQMVHEWICKPISTCICCKGWEECARLTLLTPGLRRNRAAPCPCASLASDGAGRAPKARLETPPPWDHRVTLRCYLVHSLEKTGCV